MYKKLNTVFYTGLFCLFIEGTGAFSMNFFDPYQQAQPKRVRQKFFPEEDQTLRRLVERHGTDRWDLIAGQMPGRNVRQCRERWKHYLSGKVGRIDWSPEEILLLKEKYNQLGPKWTKIASFFENKTDIQIKNKIRKLQSSNDLGFSEHDLALRKRLEYEDNLRRSQVPDLSCNALIQPGGFFFATMSQSFDHGEQPLPSNLPRGIGSSPQPIFRSQYMPQLERQAPQANFVQPSLGEYFPSALMRSPMFHPAPVQKQIKSAEQTSSSVEPLQLEQRELVSQAVQTQVSEMKETAVQSEPITITLRGEKVDENENFRNSFGQNFNILACNWDLSVPPYPDVY